MDDRFYATFSSRHRDGHAGGGDTGDPSHRSPHVPSGFLASSRHHGPPREMLYKTKYVALDEFTRDVKNQTIAGYAKLPREEKMRLFGSSIVPIFVPLAPGETAEQYEMRFAAWVKRVYGFTVKDLENHEDENLERLYRMRFASANGRGAERFDPGDIVRREEHQEDRQRERRDHHHDHERARSRSRSPARSISSSNSHNQRRYSEQRSQYRGDNSRHERSSLSPARSISSSGSHEIQEHYVRHPSNGQLLPRKAFYVKKYVELDQYKIDYTKYRIVGYARLPDHEKQELFGSTVVPIHVPLARGESMRQYEERFIKWLGREGYGTLRDVETDRDEMRERVLRIKFANLNATGQEKFVVSESKQGRDRPQLDKSPRPVKKVARTEGERSPSTSLFSPPSNQETKRATVSSQESSSRRGHSPTDAKLQTMAVGRDCSFRKPPEEASTSAVANAYIACGCRQCLVEGTRFLTDKVAGLASGNACKTCHTNTSVSENAAQRGVVDLTQDEDPQSPRPNDSNRFAAAIAKLVTSNTIVDELSRQLSTNPTPLTRCGVDMSNDPVEKQLLAEYETINQTVITHEKALGDLAARLANIPVTDTAETTRLQDENQSLRKVIQQHSDHRNAALAMVIVHIWRHKKDHLERQLGVDQSKNVLHIQRTTHEKCSSLAAEIGTAQEKLDAIKQQLDAAKKITSSSTNEEPSQQLALLTRLGQLLTKTENELRGLLRRRREQFVTLMEFDQQLRLLVDTLQHRNTR